MKRILYVSDVMLNHYNSIRDILYNTIKTVDSLEYEQVIMKSFQRCYNATEIECFDKIKVYSTKSQSVASVIRRKDISFTEKVNYCFSRFLNVLSKRIGKKQQADIIAKTKYLKMILEREKIQMVVFFMCTPDKEYVNLCVKQKIPYISILYDTYIGRPGVDKKEGYNTEKFVIDNSAGYYVPDFFYKLYSKTYDTTKVSCMNLPLLIEKQLVSEAYRTTKFDYSFTYFGQIQSFRNGDVVKQLFKDLNITLDIFSTEKIDSDDVFRLHPAVTNRELYNVVAGSKYLVAFDNSPPYQDYLPSKAYLYVSFTKPIIVFGNNENSALRDFLSNYPWVYYQNINESTEGLAEFLKKDIPDSFDESVYSRFSDYLPTNALEPIINNIKRVIG